VIRALADEPLHRNRRAGQRTHRRDRAKTRIEAARAGQESRRRRALRRRVLTELTATSYTIDSSRELGAVDVAWLYASFESFIPLASSADVTYRGIVGAAREHFANLVGQSYT